MFLKSNEERFFFEVQGASDEFHLLKMTGTEALSQSYRFEIEVVAPYPDIELTPLLGQAALLTLQDQTHAGDAYTRWVHGVVTEAELLVSSLKQSTYRFILQPKTELLRLRSGCRIFQQQSVKEIVTTVLEDAGFANDEFSFELQMPHLVREYCVQYNESELHFIQRLLEEEGIHYYFEHAEDLHRIVFSDSSQSHEAIDDEATVPYYHDAQGALREQHIFQFDYHQAIVSGRSEIRDYDFTRPRLKLASEQQAALDHALEVYRYPGRYQTTDLGDHYAQVLLESINAERHKATAQSDVNRLLPGRSFKLDEHERDELNIEYYITQVAHECTQPQVLEQGSTTEGSSYCNAIEAIPFSVPYRAALETAMPKVHGCQTAIVCGPVGEEIYTDEHGRIKVQFHWDRIGQRDESSSCWLRVSQLFAGQERGSLFLPRIGEEVLIDFLESNPDQPVVSGRVYHGLNRSPYPLPENKTVSTIKTNSSKGGGGFNEIRIEDKQGEEQIFTHAEKDMQQVTRNDHKEWVGNEHHKIIVSDEQRHIKGDEHSKTRQRYSRQVQGEMHLSIGQHHQLQVTQSQYTHAGQELHFTSGTKHALQAGVEIAFKAGGSLVTLSPGGVTLKGAQVKLNKGGGGSGTRARPRVPGPLQAPNLTTTSIPLHQPGVTELPEGEEILPKVSIRLSPIPGGPGYPEEPYTLYRNGALIQEGLTDKRGFIQVEHIPGTTEYEVEWANGQRFALNVQEQTSDGPQGQLENIQRQGYRKEAESGDAPISPQGSAAEHQVAWAQANQGKPITGSIKDDNHD